MSLRAKTKRRLFVLSAVLLLLIGGAVWLIRAPAARMAARLNDLRSSGMAAYHRGDFEDAMPQLSQFLTDVKINEKTPNDQELDALYAFADCRRNVPLPQGRHLVEASGAFDRYLTYRPTDVKVLRDQMRALTALDRQPAVMSTADQLLAQQPNDAEALAARMEAMDRQPDAEPRNVEKAVAALLAADPANVRGLVVRQTRKMRSGTPPQEAIDELEKLAAEHPADPRYKMATADLLMSVAGGDAGKQDAQAKAKWDLRSRELLVAAAAGEPPAETPVVQRLVAMLNSQGLFEPSLQVLQKAVASPGSSATQPASDPREPLRQELVRRLWQNLRMREVVANTDGLDVASHGTSADFLAYRAMALQSLSALPDAGDGRSKLLNDVDALIHQLGTRDKSDSAIAWATLLKLSEKPQTPGLERIRVLREAAKHDPSNAVVLNAMAEAFASVGETEAAVQMWGRALSRRPDWGYPFSRIARVRIDEGRLDEAERCATLACMRSPALPQFAALRVQTQYANLGKTPDPALLQDILANVERVQEVYPNDPGTLPLYVTLLARIKGKDTAADRLKKSLAAQPQPSADTLLQLQAVDDQFGLEQGEALTSAMRRANDGGLSAALLRARDLLSDGKPQEGLTLLRDAQAKAGAADDPQWLLRVAEFQDQAHDAAAPATWAMLGKKTPDDLFIQTQILRSPSRQLDPAMWQQAIDRVHKLTGDDGSLWKFERVRLILSQPTNDKDLPEAVALMTDVVQRNRDSSEAHRLYALALSRDHQAARAADELAAAALLAPTRTDIALDLVKALREAGKTAEARGRLDKLIVNPNLTPEQRLQGAQLYDALGRREEAARLLLQLPAGGQRDALLGQVYARDQKPEADDAFQRILDDANAAPGQLIVGAEWFAGTGRADRAQPFLDRLQKTAQTSSESQILLAAYAERHATAADARNRLEHATRLEPNSAKTWLALAGFELRTRQFDAAAKTIDEGLTAAGQSEELQSMKTVVQRARQLNDIDPIRELIDTLSRSPTDAAANDTLRVVIENQAALNKAKPGEEAAIVAASLQRLGELAKTYPDHWMLQNQLIGQYMRSHRWADAAALAEQAMTRFPNLVEPAELATSAYAAMEKWDRAALTATAWKERSGSQTLAPDLAIAESMMAQQQPKVAATILEPYIRKAASATTQSASATQPTLAQSQTLSLYGTYGRALVRSGRYDEAAEKLRPLLSLGLAGRTVWCSIAGSFSQAGPALKWMQTAAHATPASPGLDDTLTLSEGWMQAGRATDSGEMLSEAAQLLEPLAQSPSADVGVLAKAATVAHYRGQHAAAANFWRRLLAKQPGSVDVKNNLAYALVNANDPNLLGEAQLLAESAVKAQPGNVEFLGTLARVQSQQKRSAEAVASFRKMLALDRDNTEAIIGLARELANGSPQDRAEARRLMNDANRVIRMSPQDVEPEVRKQAAQLQATLDASPR